MHKTTTSRGSGSEPRAKTENKRALRVLFVANDGFSAGHVTRTLAIAKALSRRAALRTIQVQMLLATTSSAHTLLDQDPSCAIVRLPAPLAARSVGFSDLERRRIVHGALSGVADAFAPDLIVADTFPSGPHGELANIWVGRCKRVLVRRAVPAQQAHDPVLNDGLTDFDLAIVASDPLSFETNLPASLRVVNVPPITIGEAQGSLSRAEARRALGLPQEGRIVLVLAGGGGDSDAVTRAAAIAEAIARTASDVTAVAVAFGPLAPNAHVSLVEDATKNAIRILRVAPLQPMLAAFDGAIAPAGYNTAHELAKAGVPAVLFAQPRPFDDQAGRAARFAEASLACVLERFDDDAIRSALTWMDARRGASSALASASGRLAIEAGGSDRAADALLDLVMSASASSNSETSEPPHLSHNDNEKRTRRAVG